MKQYKRKCQNGFNLAPMLPHEIPDLDILQLYNTKRLNRLWQVRQDTAIVMSNQLIERSAV
jgi:hypothetical protein